MISKRTVTSLGQKQSSEGVEGGTCGDPSSQWRGVVAFAMSSLVFLSATLVFFSPQLKT